MLRIQRSLVHIMDPQTFKTFQIVYVNRLIGKTWKIDESLLGGPEDFFHSKASSFF
jgi:hypothetical protein